MKFSIGDYILIPNGTYTATDSFSKKKMTFTYTEPEIFKIENIGPEYYACSCIKKRNV